MKTINDFESPIKAAEWYDSLNPGDYKKKVIRNEDFLKSFCIELSKIRIKKSYGFDNLLTIYVELFDYYNTLINEFFERVFEFYNLHSPEKSYKIQELSKFLSSSVERTKDSAGMNLSKEDKVLLKNTCNELKNLDSQKEKIKKRVKKLMNNNAKNISEVAGEILGAKLIAHAGSLRELALMPSSTVQVMGAEKALFKHLTQHTKPPKHGLIFIHPLVSGVKRRNRGKMARALAAKITIAARVDYYSEEKEVWDDLLKDLEKKKKGLK